MHAIRPPKTAIAFAFALQLAGNCLAADAAADSFERMLAHQPGRGVPAAQRAEVDPLLQAIVIPLREGAPRSMARPDAVADSFARMFAHEPNRVAPAVPAGLGGDPLIAAMVEPLRQWLAQPDPAPRYAGCTAAGTAQRAGVCGPARPATPLD
jgi:hypothetical protein